MENVLKIPLGLTAAASAADPAIQNKTFGSGMTTLIIANEEMNDIIKIVKPPEESFLLIKGVSETVKNEAGTLDASLLRNLLTGKDTIRPGEGKVRASQNF